MGTTYSDIETEQGMHLHNHTLKAKGNTDVDVVPYQSNLESREKRVLPHSDYEQVMAVFPQSDFELVVAVLPHSDYETVDPILHLPLPLYMPLKYCGC